MNKEFFFFLKNSPQFKKFLKIKRSCMQSFWMTISSRSPSQLSSKTTVKPYRFLKTSSFTDKAACKSAKK
jgi:hypothetical protein